MFNSGFLSVTDGIESIKSDFAKYLDSDNLSKSLGIAEELMSRYRADLEAAGHFVTAANACRDTYARLYKQTRYKIDNLTVYSFWLGTFTVDTSYNLYRQADLEALAAEREYTIALARYNMAHAVLEQFKESF